MGKTEEEKLYEFLEKFDKLLQNKATQEEVNKLAIEYGIDLDLNDTPIVKGDHEQLINKIRTSTDQEIWKMFE